MSLTTARSERGGLELGNRHGPDGRKILAWWLRDEKPTWARRPPDLGVVARTFTDLLKIILNMSVVLRAVLHLRILVVLHLP
jgi:hypothetical protein